MSVRKRFNFNYWQSRKTYHLDYVCDCDFAKKRRVAGDGGILDGSQLNMSSKVNNAPERQWTESNAIYQKKGREEEWRHIHARLRHIEKGGSHKAANRMSGLDQIKAGSRSPGQIVASKIAALKIVAPKIVAPDRCLPRNTTDAPIAFDLTYAFRTTSVSLFLL